MKAIALLKQINRLLYKVNRLNSRINIGFRIGEIYFCQTEKSMTVKNRYTVIFSVITISLFSQINLLDYPLVKDHSNSEEYKDLLEEKMEKGSDEEKITATILKAYEILASDLDPNSDDLVDKTLEKAKNRLDKKPDPRNLYLYYYINGSKYDYSKYSYLDKNFKRLSSYIEALKVKKEANLIDPYFLVERGLMDHYLDVEDYVKIYDLREAVFHQIDEYKLDAYMKSEIYRMSSLAAKELNQFEKAQQDIDSAMVYAERYNDSVSITRVHKYQSELFLDLKKYEEAYKEALEAEKLYQVYDSKNINQVYFLLGVLNYERGNFEEAKVYLKKALDSGKLFIKHFMKASDYYRTILEKENKLEEAYSLLKKEDSIKGNIANQNYYKRILDFELDYQQFQNDTILEEKKKQTQWIVFVLGLALIVIVLLSLLLYERLRHIKKLKRVNFKLSQFNKIISHDLKSPIRSIGALATFIKEDEETLKDSSVQYINLIHESVMTTENLILNMLALARSEDGIFEKEIVLYDDILRRVTSNLLYDINESGAEIIIKSKPYSFYGNKTMLIQLFQNFIQNAIKYRNKKVPVVIELDYIASEQKITIKDNGIGIDVEDTEILFEAYHQQKFESVKEGVGIGLYIAKMIADLHRIKIKIHSKLNQGTTIELYFNEDVIQD